MKRKIMNLQIYSLLEMEADYYLAECLYEKEIARFSSVFTNKLKNRLRFFFQWFSLRPLLGVCSLFLCSFIGFVLGILSWSLQMDHHFWRGLLQGIAIHVLFSVAIPLLFYFTGRVLGRCMTKKHRKNEALEFHQRKLQHQSALLDQYYDMVSISADYRNYVALRYLTDILENTDGTHSLTSVEDLSILMTSVKREMEHDRVWESAKALRKDLEQPIKHLERMKKLLPDLKSEHRQSLQKIQEKADRLMQNTMLSNFYEVQEEKNADYFQLFHQTNRT